MGTPRILIVTPEISYLPENLGNMAQHMRAKAGGLADVSASLVSALYRIGADVHVAIPNYRRMFKIEASQLIESELRLYHSKLPDDRIHLAEDRTFYYRDQVYSSYSQENQHSSLVFQREVINNIIPRVRPDIIHCNDWMTAMIPAMARRMGIPSLFTIHNIHTVKFLLEHIEASGIDTAEFWQHLYYEYPPESYEQCRSNNPVDMLASGLFAAHWINTVSPSFLDEIVEGEHAAIPPSIRTELQNKRHAGYASGILNAPDPSYHPESDTALVSNYNSDHFEKEKSKNKKAFQKRMRLDIRPDAPLFFWPSRLDPMQKGPELLSGILTELVSAYKDDSLQIALVADGEYHAIFQDIITLENLQGSVSIQPFDESLSRLGFAASDFMLMPSKFEPCGLTQMIALKYGSLPIVRDTGGLKDTVSHLDPSQAQGNGFVFEDYDTQGLRWAIDCAMDFFHRPSNKKSAEIQRIMAEATTRFTHEQTADQYVALYEEMLGRPLEPDD
ncbi:MAG: glycogen/starch synthase [Verrucomicrobiae bacterium]|nr:glycogen/starch synthase [Verrucomicrobiae bacterium]NNJ43816.1 glycosyltransferase [Akkermansiaceae bacterium]